MPTSRIHLIHGTNEVQVNEARLKLIGQLLPPEDREAGLVELRPRGSVPFTLAANAGEIIGELGTGSLIPGILRVVVVHDLRDFDKDIEPGGRKAGRRAAHDKGDPFQSFQEYIERVLPTLDAVLIFVYNDDEEKRRKVSKATRLYKLVESLGVVQSYEERRVDWQLGDAIAAGDITRAVELLRSFRSGAGDFRIFSTICNAVELTLQARLRLEAQRDGVRVEPGVFPREMRPSLEAAPSFVAKKWEGLARRVDLPRLRRALRRVYDLQKATWPSGEELVVHDPTELAELVLLELLGGGGRA